MKLSLLIITTIFCLNARAQVKKGAILLGGNIGYFKQSERLGNNRQNSNSNFIITPSYGKAIKQNLILGFDVLYQGTINDNDSLKYKISSFGADIFVRKYMYLGSNFYLFGESTFGGNINSRKLKNSNSVIRKDGNGFGIQLAFTPGISYALNKHLQLETKFYNFLYAAYTHTRFTDVPAGVNPYTLNTIALNTNLGSLSNFVIGLRVLINGDDQSVK